MTLSENIFQLQSKLIWLHLNENPLTALPEKIFNNQTNVEPIYLNGCHLKTLPKNIFNGPFSLDVEQQEIKLKDNPWLCDAVFIDIVRKHKDKFDYEEIVCADGMPLPDKN